MEAFKNNQEKLNTIQPYPLQSHVKILVKPLEKSFNVRKQQIKGSVITDGKQYTIAYSVKWF